MTAGYSGTPLVKKLGLKSGARMRVVGAPPDYARLLGPLPEGVDVVGTTRGSFDFIHLFVTRKNDLLRRFDPLKKALDKTGCLWISWPKKTSSIDSDLSGDIVRGFGLKQGLVDIKVCAVDDDWSALKFVYRVKDR